MYDKDLIKIYNRILSTLVNSLYTIYTHYIISQVVKPGKDYTTVVLLPYISPYQTT